MSQKQDPILESNQTPTPADSQDLNPLGTAGLAIAGAPWRATMGIFMPMTFHLLRQAAMARHAMAVHAVYGQGPLADRMMEQHEKYVKAFYGY